jgi:hypothetical protein
LKLDSLRAVVTADRALIFDPLHPAVQSFLTVLHDRLRSDAAAESEAELDSPFELRVLEEVLISVVRDSVVRIWLSCADVLMCAISALLWSGSTAQ